MSALLRYSVGLVDLVASIDSVDPGSFWSNYSYYLLSFIIGLSSSIIGGSGLFVYNPCVGLNKEDFC
jgi:hypothetical protein